MDAPNPAPILTSPPPADAAATAGVFADALTALARCAPATLVALALLQAHRGVLAVCAVAAAPWCDPGPRGPQYFGSPAFHLATALQLLVSAVAAALVAALLVPRLAAAWPGGVGGAAGGARRPGAGARAVARAGAIEGLFFIIALPAFAVSWWLAVRRGGFGPSGPEWNLYARREILYSVVTALGLGPLHVLWLVVAVVDDLPLWRALKRAASSLVLWPVAVFVPLFVLSAVRPDNLVNWAMLTGLEPGLFALMTHPVGSVVLTLAQVALTAYALAVGVGLWRRTIGPAGAEGGDDAAVGDGASTAADDAPPAPPIVSGRGR